MAIAAYAPLELVDGKCNDTVAPSESTESTDYTSSSEDAICTQLSESSVSRHLSSPASQANRRCAKRGPKPRALEEIGRRMRRMRRMGAAKASEGDAGSEKGSEGDSDADSEDSEKSLGKLVQRVADWAEVSLAEAPRQAPAPDLQPTPEPSGSNGSGFTQQPQRQQHHQQQSMNSLDFGGGFNYVQQQPGAMPDMFAAHQQQQQQQAAQQASQQQQARQEQMLMQQSQQQQQQQAVDAKANMLLSLAAQYPQICRGQKRWWLASADIPFPKQEKLAAPAYVWREEEDTTDAETGCDEVSLPGSAPEERGGAAAWQQPEELVDCESEDEEVEVNFCKKRQLQHLETTLVELDDNKFEDLLNSVCERRSKRRRLEEDC